MEATCYIKYKQSTIHRTTEFRYRMTRGEADLGKKNRIDNYGKMRVRTGTGGANRERI